MKFILQYYCGLRLEIYIESVLIDNLVINSILLYLTAKVLSYKLVKTRIVFSTCFATLMSFVFPLFNLNGIILFILKLLLGGLIILLAFKIDTFKDFLRLFFAFLILTAVMGGACFMLCFAFKSTAQFSGGNLVYDGLPMGIVVLVVFVVCKLIVDFIKFLDSKEKIKKFKFKTIIKNSGKEYNFMGFLDSGNILVDSMTQKPVIVIGIGVFKKLFNLSNEDIIKGNFSLQNSRYIKVNTATKLEKMLVFEVEEVIVEFDTPLKLESAILGVALKNFKKQFDCDLLLNLKLVK